MDNVSLVSSELDLSNKKDFRNERTKRKISTLAEVIKPNELPDGGSPERGDSTERCGESKQAKLVDSDGQEIIRNQSRVQNVPKLRLREIGEDAKMGTTPEDRVPLLLGDIQALVMHSLLRSDSPTNPSHWVAVEKSARITHTTVLLVEGLTADDFIEHEKKFKQCSKIFPNILQVVIPNERLVEELVCVPLSDTQKDILLAEHGSFEAALACKDQMLIGRNMLISNVFGDDPIDGEEPEDYSSMNLPQGDKFPRTQLLLSPIQMINERYPLPLTGNLKHRYDGYITSNDHYKPVTPSSPLFGLDCEMCLTSIGTSELTRVSIVDEQGNEFYETLVRPVNAIVDYVTQFSGITPEMLKNVSKTLQDVHKDLKNKLPPDAILVGQSLNFDLHALKMMHPYVIDTSILFNLTGTRGAKTKLKILAKRFLQQDIQCSSVGHNSIEDSMASLQLVKLKLSKNVCFGDQWLQDRRNYRKRVSALGIATQEEIQRFGTNKSVRQITATLFGYARKKYKKSVVLTHADNLDDIERCFGDAIQDNAELKKFLRFEKLESDASVIERTAASCLNYDFNLSCIQLSQDNLKSVETKKVKIKQIDGWIRKVFEAVSVNGLVVVLLAGGAVTQTSRMAVAMAQIKQA